nr:uncharacterized protein LOC117685556 isoform X2 [Crassostrea gigas]
MVSEWNDARKNEERSKNPVLRDLLQQPPKTTCTQEQQQQQNTPSPKKLSEFQSLWNNLQLELDLKDFDSGNSPQEEQFSTLDIADLDDQSVHFQKYLVSDNKATPCLNSSAMTIPSTNTIPSTKTIPQQR